MEVSTINIIISAITGFITGVIASLIAPWIHWRIERKKIILNRKIELVDKSREFLNKQEFNNKEFRETDIYSRIRPYLSKELIQKIEKADNNIHVQLGGRGGGVDNFRNKILDELNSLEQEWGLR